MATMFFSKDGPRPDNQRGPGIELTLAEIEAIFSKEYLRYLGDHPPTINQDRPSHSLKNVVLLVDHEDGTSPKLAKSGFYLVMGLRPQEAEDRLREHRSRRQTR